MAGIECLLSVVIFKNSLEHVIDFPNVSDQCRRREMVNYILRHMKAILI